LRWRPSRRDSAKGNHHLLSELLPGIKENMKPSWWLSWTLQKLSQDLASPWVKEYGALKDEETGTSWVKQGDTHPDSD